MTNARAFNNVADEDKSALAATTLYYNYCLDLEGIIEIGEIYNNQIRTLSKQYNIPLVDLEEQMPGGRKYFVDGSHFTLTGEKFAAQAIFESIKNNKL